MRRRPIQRRLAAWMLLALLFAQWLAMGHAVRHASAIAAFSQALGDEARDALGGQHEAGTSTCAVLDHLLSGHGPAPHVAATPVCRLGSLPPQALPASAWTAPEAAYDARAPPSRA